MKHVHDKNRHAVTFCCRAPVTNGVFLDQGVVLGGRVRRGSSSQWKVKCCFDHLPPEQQEGEKARFLLNMACNYTICSMHKPAIQKVAIEDDDMLSSRIRISSSVPTPKDVFRNMAGRMPPSITAKLSMQALDTLGNTKWRVNRRVLSVVEILWSRGGNIAGLVDREDVPLPEKTLSEAPMEIAAWKWSVRKAKKISRERHAL
ncbi:hypothetical protein Ancab_027662 [Ancistrocladus abbreviatus]